MTPIRVLFTSLVCENTRTATPTQLFCLYRRHLHFFSVGYRRDGRFHITIVIRSLTFVSSIPQALELNPGDQNALVTRSKCYLLLGEPAKGLADAEEALTADKANIRAIYQKAEALYFLGQFEHSLMFFHRGLRLRPEMNLFRLGVQKSREAIEQTIGGFVPKQSATSVRSQTTTARRGSGATSTTAAAMKSAELTARTTTSLAACDQAKQPQPAANDAATAKTATKIATRRRPRTAANASKLTPEQREAKRLLGELCVDKSYLENLLKHPSIKRADADGEQTITAMARDAVQFLDTRQEFWRQQRPCKSAFPLLKKRLAEGAVLK